MEQTLQQTGRGRHGANVLWQDDHTALLVSLVGKLSCSAMAAELNERFDTAYTRNAVIGKITRLGLGTPMPKRDPQDIAAARKARQNRANALRMEQRREAGIPAAAPRIPKAVKQEAILRCVEIEPLHLSLMQLEAGNCRWPYGEDQITFCGHPQFDPSSYCGGHFFLSIGAGTGSERAAHKVAKSKLQGAW